MHTPTRARPDTLSTVRPAPLVVPVLVLVLASALLAGCPVVAALPPTKTEVAPVAAIGSDSSAGLRVSAGAHWASGDLGRARSLDLGGGYVYERAHDRPSYDNGSHGGYLELQTRMASGRSWRAWVGLRGELLGGERSFGGAAARVSWELTAPTYGATPFEGRCASGILGFYGRAGIGFYAESGYRQYAQDQAVTVTAGLSIRLPAVALFALFLPLPGC